MSHANTRWPALQAQAAEKDALPAARRFFVSPSIESNIRSAAFPLNRAWEVRRSVLLSICANEASQVVPLNLSPRQWNKLLLWLDISGMALYLLEHFKHLDLHEQMPVDVRRRLQQNMNDNTKRTLGMVEESVALQRGFQDAGVTYSVMKGLSLCPIAVPRPELRHQFDLDYLVAESSALEARRILERRGYRLSAISGKSWEFKINETPYVSIKDLYKDLPYRSVELHIEHEDTKIGSRLARSVRRTMFGLSMPVYAPIDLFLHQTMHVFKNVCSAHTRTAHILEFYRHVVAHFADDAFWHALRVETEEDLTARLGIGVVTYLVSSALGEFAPKALTQWTVDRLPAPLRLWVDLYGKQVVFGDHPGSKLYLLLQKELEIAGIPLRLPVKAALVPRGLPQFVIQSAPDETFITTLARYRVQGRYLCSRLRFHVVEGLRYAVESRRWRKHLERLSS